MNAVPSAVAATSARARRRKAMRTSSEKSVQRTDRGEWKSGDYKSAGMDSGVNKRLHSCACDPVPLVSRSANYYASRPLVASRRCRRRIVMIVKSARLRGDQIIGLVTLSGGQHAD